MNEKLNVIDKSSPIPVYHQIVNDLSDRISRREWRIGDQLPSEPMLSEEYDVSRITIRQALAELQRSGIITRYQGRGAFLSSNLTCPPILVPVPELVEI